MYADEGMITHRMLMSAKRNHQHKCMGEFECIYSWEMFALQTS
jgi:hypothetical protein